MKRHIILSLLLLLTVGAGTFVLKQVSAQEERPDAVLLTDNFAFSGALNANGWGVHSGAGTNALTTTTGLTYAGFTGSGVGNAVAVGSLGGEDVNRGFTEVNANGANVYFAALVNVNDAADRAGDYFLHLGDRVDAATFTLFASRVYVRTVGTAVNFGLSNTGTATYGTTNFAKNTTYLLVVKYTINNTGNDSTSLWVLPSGVPATEAAAGTAELINTGTAGQDVIDAIAIRQGTSGSGPTLTLDGLRVGDTWADAVGAAGGASPTPTATPAASPTPSPTATATPSGSPSPTPAGTLPKRLFTTRMVGSQEVPANASTARGYGRVVLNAAETQITASFYFENLGSNSTAGHIHTGAVGVAGPITFDMAPPTGVTRGSVVDKTFAITPAQLADLRAGNMYFNVHSVNFPGGEIRGQLLTTTNDAPLDFNGDGKTDFSVVRQTTGAGGTQARWYNLTNSTPAVESQVDFGVTSDSLTPGDFDGDGKDDIAVWRSSSSTNSAVFYILQSTTNTLRTVKFGVPNDDPFLIQDYDGDGVDDPAIFRRGDTGQQSYFWWYGSFGTTRNAEVPVAWGGADDTGVPGDFNGDGKADFCVYRSTGGSTAVARGVFLIHYGTGGFDAASANDSATRFGLNSTAGADSVVPGDWDGDGKTDFSVTRFEGANLQWYILQSSNQSTYIKQPWGRTGDTEVQGDYDGDGRTDYAVWRGSTTDAQGVVNPQGIFYVLRSGTNSAQYQNWGINGDIPAGIDSH